MHIATADPVLFYADLFPAFVASLRQMGVDGVPLRERALATLVEDGFDVRGREEWKFGDIAPVRSGGFLPRSALDVRAGGAPALPPADDALRLVFLNGRFRTEDSSALNTLPPGVRVRPLAEAGSSRELGSVADMEGAPLTALNTAYWQDGLLLRLEPGTALERPIELIFFADGRAAGSLLAPRNLIVAGRGSRAAISERYLSADGVKALNLPVTEVICEPGSDIRHLKWLGEQHGILHYGSTHVRQGAGSRYASREFLLGGSRIRREVHVRLAGDEAVCDLSGLSLAGGDQRTDARTRVHHEALRCRTQEIYKGIFMGHSQGVFDGLIKVAPGAQGTQAYQSNRNLLLGDEAASRSIPRLEIYADDVKCSHGSATGRLAEDQIYYLRSRGFAAGAARDLLAHAFASEVVDGVENLRMREELTGEIRRRLAEVRE